MLTRKTKTQTDAIRKLVCDYYDISERALLSERRDEAIAIPRMIVMYLCREVVCLTLHDCGVVVRRNDHNTATNATRRIKDLMSTEPALKDQVTYLTEKAEAIIAPL